MSKGLEEDLTLSLMIKERIQNNQYAHELYCALCNIQWWHEEINGPQTMSWRYAAGLVASLRAKHEDYLDWYCGGARDSLNGGRDPFEGEVTERIANDMKLLGWTYTNYPGDEDERT